MCSRSSARSSHGNHMPKIMKYLFSLMLLTSCAQAGTHVMVGDPITTSNITVTSSGTVSGDFRAFGTLDIGSDATGPFTKAHLRFGTTSASPSLTLFAGGIGASSNSINFATNAGTIYATLNANPSISGPLSITTPSGLAVTYGLEVGTMTIDNGGSSGQTVCWKTATTLGFCSSVVGVGGACTCN